MRIFFHKGEGATAKGERGEGGDGGGECEGNPHESAQKKLNCYGSL